MTTVPPGAGDGRGPIAAARSGVWRPAGIDEVVTLFAASPAPWWIAGGYAIELFTGIHRPHGDIDVLMLHRDQAAVRQVLDGWDCWVADPPGTGTLRPWPVNERLPAHLHDVWCRPAPDEPWRIQVMLDDASGDEWVSRRHPGVRRSIAAIGVLSERGVPYLAPEIQLFYKAKNPRPKDEWDVAAALPLLSRAARSWLDDAVELAYPGRRDGPTSSATVGTSPTRYMKGFLSL
jgi:hypothetical protein